MNQKYNKQEILFKGIYLFRRKGYHHTGIKMILDECGIPKGSFYNFFKNKKDFGLQCLRLYGTSMLRLIQHHTLDETLSPLERIQAYLDMTIQANEEEEMRYGCLLMNTSSELAGYNDAFATLANEIYEAWIDTFADCIAEGQEKGEIISEIPAPDLATFIYNSIFGGFVAGKSQRSIDGLQKVLATCMQFIAVV